MMKTLFDLVPWPLRWLLTIVAFLVLAGFTLDDRMDGKVYAMENRVMQVRKDDMEYLREELSAIKADTTIIKTAFIQGKK